MVGGVPIFNQTNQLHIEHGEIHLQILVNLGLCHLRIAIKMSEGFVDHVEHLTPDLLLTENLTTLGMHRMEVITLHHQFGYLSEFLRHTLFGHNDFIFHIVVILLPAAKLFNVLGIIGIIIYRGHRSHLIEAFNKHTFRIHISKSQRADNLCHPLLTSPFLNCIEEGLTHLDVIDEIHPSETHTLALPLLVGPMVDDAGNTPYQLAILIGHEILGLAELESSILILAQRMDLVAV